MDAVDAEAVFETTVVGKGEVFIPFDGGYFAEATTKNIFRATFWLLVSLMLDSMLCSRKMNL